MLDSVNELSKIDASYAPTNPCETCIKGKFAASPNHDAATTHYAEYGHHMTSDLYGPILKTAYKGIRYLYTLLDTTTKWLDFSLLKTKKETLGAFKTMKTAAENQSGKKIKILRTDWGREFVNAAFDALLTECGIVHEHSAPYAHEQNGAAERVNRTIMEKARCLLFQCGLSTYITAHGTRQSAKLHLRLDSGKSRMSLIFAYSDPLLMSRMMNRENYKRGLPTRVY